jgi:predicted glycoside hydrolase/deacetylase ChbG (UPF0249 family)
MKYLIVNADDFGAGLGINRAIAQCHQTGILTSTSLMVNGAASADAARIAEGMPRLGVGLHTVLTNEDCSMAIDFADARACRAEIVRQCVRFKELMGRMPTHVDAHHNVHRHPLLAGLFRELASTWRLPLRENSAVTYLPDFYGQWDGESHPEQISVESLRRMLEEDLRGDITELSCHPGYAHDDFPSTYMAEREIECATLCDPAVRDHVRTLGITLTNYAELGERALGATA